MRTLSSPPSNGRPSFLPPSQRFGRLDLLATLQLLAALLGCHFLLLSGSSDLRGRIPVNGSETLNRSNSAVSRRSLLRVVALSMLFGFWSFRVHFFAAVVRPW